MFRSPWLFHSRAPPCTTDAGTRSS
jgi:hypothetical protein